MVNPHEHDPVIIRKYANRRLYNTQTSTYITLEELRLMVKEGTHFIVQDAKTGEDLTRQTLAQIIFEQETKGFAMLPTDFLRKVVGYYDDNMSEVLKHYLMASMNGFVQNQDKMKQYVGKVGKVVEEMLPAVNQFEEITKQNLALFEKTFSAFNPFAGIFQADEAASKSTSQPKPSKRGKK